MFHKYIVWFIKIWAFILRWKTTVGKEVPKNQFYCSFSCPVLLHEASQTVVAFAEYQNWTNVPASCRHLRKYTSGFVDWIYTFCGISFQWKSTLCSNFWRSSKDNIYLIMEFILSGQQEMINRLLESIRKWNKRKKNIYFWWCHLGLGHCFG